MCFHGSSYLKAQCDAPYFRASVFPSIKWGLWWEVSEVSSLSSLLCYVALTPLTSLQSSQAGAHPTLPLPSRLQVQLALEWAWTCGLVALGLTGSSTSM